MSDVEPRTHPITLTTRTKYVIPASKYMIPSSWARYHLSQLINKVLASPRPVPFDFLINGELLTGPLSEWCNEHNIGEEETIEIEYIESVLPPELLAAEETDDWTSSISAKFKNIIRRVSSRSAHSFDEEQTIASSSFDHTIHLSRLSPTTLESTTLATLHLHTAPVSSVAVDPPGQQLISAGWDGLVGIWSVDIPDKDEVQDVQEPVQKKRRKLDGSVARPVRKAPVAVLKSHTSRVSKAIFGGPMDRQKAYSCGWDSTVRSWDIESGVCVNTVTLPDRTHLDIAASTSGDLLYTASADRTVSLLDFRSTSVHSSAKTLTHPSTPSCLAVHPASTHHLLTGAYDGVLRVWDIRSPRAALAKFEHITQGKSGASRRGKVLDVDWQHGLAACAGEVGFGIWQAGVGGSE
ncbi:ribosome biogenesis protein YTM1 [Ceratobasidium sp. AG-Ba]|nr:ribosome biogenesis protein YTM1 [Ceratobasidium sp. AG-Ba]